MKKTLFYILFFVALLGVLEIVGRSDWITSFQLRRRASEDSSELRIGYFPNITHAQALIAQQMELEGRPWFIPRLPAGTKLVWQPYNAGPAAMEGLTLGTIDMSYVGPSPAIMAYIQRGGSVRVVSGSAEGGAALVVRQDVVAKNPGDFVGKAIATPQLGNTQDVACRAWLIKNGVPVTTSGGEVQIVPTKNPDQLALFKAGTLEAAWTVEPWVSRLELEAGGKIAKEDFATVTTVLASATDTIAKRKPLLEAFVKAHAELTAWINAHPEEAKTLLQRALTRETKSEFPQRIVNNAFPRIKFVSKLNGPSLKSYIEDGYTAGLIPEKIDVAELVSFEGAEENSGTGIFPLPSEIVKFLWNGLFDGSIPNALWVTLRRLVIGYAIGFVLAVPLGLLLAQSRFMRDTLGVLALGFQSLPSVCWVPISLVIFGQDERTILSVVVMGSVWSLMLATENGIRSVPPLYVRAARTMGSKNLHLWARVMFPAALPSIFSGMKQGWAFAWRSLMSAEIYVYILSGIGLGWMLNAGREEMNVEKVYGVMLVIIIVGLVMDRLCFAPVERWLRERWGLEK